ncbi:hypothetical protein Y032_0243g3479 [Ancylostoma ceylanicum]|uniref:CULT domain-containing protein n=1 Tax=Ancylostoma ceylanicum TaxID=53326 RepID=A0A016SE35_9BILA|nr:hypothetical protein Y032_0243g3479 [Ancylostoma ceylanicum]
MFDGGRRSSDDEGGYHNNNNNGNDEEREINVEAMGGEDSSDELEALDAAVNLQHGIRNGVRQFLRILNVRARRGSRGVDVHMRAVDSSDEESGDEEDTVTEASDGEPSRNFDVHESSKHQYLFKPTHASEEVDMGATMWLQPGKEHTVPVISLDLVVLPGQMVPMQIHNAISRSIVQRAIDSRSYLGLLPVVPGEANMNRERYGILLQVNKYVSDGLTMKVHAIGRQRFRVISFENETSSSSMARVEVLNDTTRAPLLQAICPHNTWNLPEKKKLTLCSEISNVPSFVADDVNLDNQCQRLGYWMKMWFSNEKIQGALDLGPISFSYWAARNIPMTLSAKYEHLVEDEANLRIVSLLNLIGQMTDLVCRGCGLLICSVRDIVNMNSEGTSSHFVNSAGYIHEMVTVAVAQNFVPRDQPCAKFSWFPGYVTSHFSNSKICFFLQSTTQKSVFFRFFATFSTVVFTQTSQISFGSPRIRSIFRMRFGKRPLLVQYMTM